MGCIWSYESWERCEYCNRKPVNDLTIENGICQICADITQSHSEQNTALGRGPYFGEYKCSCGRFWNSRLCWPNSYQNCKKCHRSVYANNFRTLRPSDMSGVDENTKEHPKELCQKCIQLGYYCGIKKSREYRKIR